MYIIKCLWSSSKKERNWSVIVFIVCIIASIHKLCRFQSFETVSSIRCSKRFGFDQRNYVTSSTNVTYRFVDDAVWSVHFAWVNIYGIKGNTKLGKMLKQAGIRQDYTRTFQIWNPAKYHCQNVDTLYVGAEAYAKVLQSYGFEAYAGSRLD
mgnify:CR=1 FL=1